MLSAISSALSGMMAATRRLDASASNVANAQSDGPLAGTGGSAASAPAAYQPVEVVQSAGTGGNGTVATYAPVKPATVPAFDPSASYADSQGLVAAPNVDPVRETVNQLTARASYEANLRTVQTADRMQKSLLDILG